ncbi:MAG: PD-(D/E)XK nuclease family protein, partial [Verrucomicrobia bacterium]|nr:PD-(D/E)XK nuclease family protein [Verrucomicrobiota bacterium]
EARRNEEGAVSIVSIHKAKGLEWGVVVLGDMARTDREPSRPVLVSPATGALEAKLAELSTAGHDEAREAEKLREEAEGRRLLYVACTRARDWLVLPWFSDRGEYPAALKTAFDPATAADIERLDRAGIRMEAAGSKPVRVKLGQPEGGDRAALEKLVAERAAWIAGRERAKAALFAGVKKLTPHKLGEREHFREAADAVAAGGGIEIGRGVHEALAACDPRDVDGAVKLFPPGEKLICRALKHELMKRILAADEWHREVPVVWESPEGLMEGYLDVLFREGDRLVIVDYKTDAKPEPKLYAEQLAAYARAVEAVTGLKVAERLLFFLSTGAVEKV